MSADTASATPGQAAFPVTWDDPADSEKTWLYNAEHMPLPSTPLAFELLLAPFLRGFGWGMNPKQFNFYTFFSFDGPRDAGEPPNADVTYLQMAARRWHDEILPEVLGLIDLYRTPDFDAMSDDELIQQIERLQDVRYRSGQLHTKCVSPYWSGHRLLIETYKELIEHDELAALRLVQGHPNKSVEAGLRLWDVAQITASVPVVRERLLASRDGVRGVFESLKTDPEARPFVDAFCAYLDDYGWRVGNDETGETWYEDPTTPLTMLRTYLEMPDYNPAAEQQKLIDDREAAIADALARLDDGGGARLREVIDAVAAVSMLSEDHNFFIDQRLATMPRRLIFATGRRLVRKGALSEPALVFFLRTAEVVDALRASTPVQETCDRRQKDLARWRKVKPPDYIGAPPGEQAAAAMAGPSVPESDRPGELRGMGVSAGVARGPARVLTHVSQAGRLRPGDVLVVPVTSPPWTPLFAVASAIVTEVGGALSHTAVVAREYSLPAVVSVKGATKQVRDGQLLEVDGAAGIVRLL
jgi:pyruvate,water dikinase